MDIVYLLLILWRKKYIIIGITVASVTIAFLSTRNIPERYKSITQLSTGFITNEGIKLNDDRFNIREADLKFTNLLSTMKSGVLINQLCYRLALHDLDSIEPPFHDFYKYSKETLTEQELYSAKKIFEVEHKKMSPLTIEEENADLQLKVLKGFGYTYPWVLRSMEIKRVPNTDYIQIEFTSHDRYISSFAVNTYYEEFVRYYAAQKAKTTNESISFFEELVNQKKSELNDKTEMLKQFKTESNLIGVESQGNRSEINEIESQITTVNSNLYGLGLRLNYLLEIKNGNSNVANNTTPEPNNNRILTLRNKISNVNSRYIESGSTNTVLLDSLNLLKQQLNFELSKTKDVGTQNSDYTSRVDIDNEIKNTEIEISIEKSKLNQLNSKLRSLNGIMSTYASKEAALNALETEYEVASEEYQDALNKYNSAKNELLTATSSIKQIIEGVPAASPIPTNRILIVGFSGALSFSLSVLIFLLWEILEGSIKTSTQYENAVPIKLLGSLIKIKTKEVNFPTLFSSKQKDKESESFKQLIRKLRFEIENANSQTFLVTSNKPQEGKSFVIFALAFALSLIKKKVLIIDTNFKSNELTKILLKSTTENKPVKNTNSETGLEVLSTTDESDYPEIKSLIQNTKFNNIFIIGNRGGQQSPEEIMQQNDFQKLIQILTTKFDYIFLEGPSLNQYADTKELVKYAERVICVFSAGKALKQLDKESIDYLTSLDGKLLGAVLNNIEYRDINL
ncbi:MAG: hypothetical protein OEW75_06480 [Cyclobacteriaceae bacterium]|nr:hypothetical protein [Cyclobacteriaceae bacterium]